MTKTYKNSFFKNSTPKLPSHCRAHAPRGRDPEFNEGSSASRARARFSVNRRVEAQSPANSVGLFLFLGRYGLQKFGVRRYVRGCRPAAGDENATSFGPAASRPLPSLPQRHYSHHRTPFYGSIMILFKSRLPFGIWMYKNYKHGVLSLLLSWGRVGSRNYSVFRVYRKAVSARAPAPSDVLCWPPLYRLGLIFTWSSPSTGTISAEAITWPSLQSLPSRQPYWFTVYSQALW